MLSDELKAEFRDLIRTELQLAVRAMVDDGMSPLAELVIEMQQKQGSLLKTLCESMGLVVEGQARIEQALAEATGSGDADEPWRQSLQDDED